MDTFTDYYKVLGVDSHASTSTIKAAFKQLALKYHPDVYKGPDAQERMRDLLIAYQTLSDPASRRTGNRRIPLTVMQRKIGKPSAIGVEFPDRLGIICSCP